LPMLGIVMEWHYVANKKKSFAEKQFPTKVAQFDFYRATLC